MKKRISNEKISQHTGRTLNQAPAAGSDTVTMVPPAYGIDVLDQAGGVTAVQRKINPLTDDNTQGEPSPKVSGLPEGLKTGIESLSGLAMDDVRVHPNSSKPAELQALAYTQGTDIHLAPGQERHLPHEAWHVVQQKQRRVKETSSVAQTPINDSPSLEREADQMSARVLTYKPFHLPSVRSAPIGQGQITQLQKTKKKSPKALGYKSLSKKNRENKVAHHKKKQHSLGRGRVLHFRHIIPHSDLQAWMLCARQTGNAGSIAGQMRRIIRNLLLLLGEATEAANWQNAYQLYEAGPLTQSFLQVDAPSIVSVWQLIEWHDNNLFLGQGGINTAIQNRFDAGKGARAYHGAGHVNALYAIWFAANTLLGLAPTAIQDTQVFATHLQRYIITRTAEHNNSRPLLAALGWFGRSDYERSL